MKGKVYLVGAGPGDPELLTLKALRLLKTADAVLHDDLVSAEVLKLVSPFAQTLNVGKRCGKKNIGQEEIHFLMIALAGSGASVVRLKGGDPLVFGRAGEEIDALRRAGIECEVVPGITAAIAAASTAQIPLTDRRMSSALIFLTGHRAADAEPVDLKHVVTSGVTLAVYMPGSTYGEIARQLRESGLSPETPCAIVSNAGRQEERVVLSSLSQLHSAPALPAPAVVLIGDVVRFARARNGAVAGLITEQFSVRLGEREQFA